VGDLHTRVPDLDSAIEGARPSSRVLVAPASRRRDDRRRVDPEDIRSAVQLEVGCGADRLFRLVQLLRARRFATGEQIADELVSKPWVCRDVADLRLRRSDPGRSGRRLPAERGASWRR
jgi:hypothetical protein